MANHFALHSQRKKPLHEKAIAVLAAPVQPSIESEPTCRASSIRACRRRAAMASRTTGATQRSSPRRDMAPIALCISTDSTPTTPIPVMRKRSRTGTVVVGAAAVAVVSGGIGAAVLANQSDPSAANSAATAATAAAPTPEATRRRAAVRLGRAGRCEGVAQRGEAADQDGTGRRRGIRHRAEFRRSDPDQQSRRRRAEWTRCRPGVERSRWAGRSGLPRSAGTARARRRALTGPSRDRPARIRSATVSFSDGNTVPFTVVGTDPADDIAVVRAKVFRA